MIRVLVITHYSELYGANLSLVEFLKAADRDRYNFVVVSPEKGGLSEILEQLNVSEINVKLFRLFYHDRISFLKCIPKMFMQRYVQKEIITKLNLFTPDVIYTNSSVITVGHRLSVFLNVPHVWHIREFRIADYNMRYLYGEGKLLRKIACSAKVIAISKSIRDSVTYKVSSDKISVIYDGLFLDHVTYTRQNRNELSTFNFGMVGVISRNKGLIGVIKVIAKLAKEKNIRPFKLLVFGDFVDERYKADILETIQFENLNNIIEFCGFEKDRNKIYEKLDCLILNSLKEGYGRVSIEAMSFGIPVIGRKSGGTVEVVQHSKVGFLFENSTELKDHMKIVLTNEDLYQELSRNAINRVMEEYNISDSVKKIQDVFEDVMP